MAFALRNDIRAGDLGTLVSLHGVVYARECGFDPTFEAHVARLVGEFVNTQTDRDRLWIAEWQGCLVGSVAIVSRSPKDAELCWLLVHPSARFVGLGSRLLHEAVAFCLHRGFEYVFLRTISALTAAARLFRSVGFEKVQQRPGERWGVAVIEEWYALHPFGRRHPLPGQLGQIRFCYPGAHEAAENGELEGFPGGMG
jgi:N-acetylglutamate synthase-like GNAT family acetyltransferase